MSVSADLKEKIIHSPYKNACCRRSFLLGVLFAKGEIREGSDKEILLSLSAREYAAFVSELVKEVYGKEAKTEAPARGGRCFLLSFSSASAAKYLENSENTENLPYQPKCISCESAFVRGIFFAAGRLTDPEKEYCLEISAKYRREAMLSFFAGAGLSPRVVHRRDEVYLHLRNSSELEGFFALCALNDITFAIMNKKIERSLRSDVNRTRNCETMNIQKAMDASVEQVSVLRRLEAAGRLGSLPEELEKTARIRLDNESLSLSQLAALFTPPISKSGLSHRLDRLMKTAKEILKME